MVLDHLDIHVEKTMNLDPYLTPHKTCESKTIEVLEENIGGHFNSAYS